MVCTAYKRAFTHASIADSTSEWQRALPRLSTFGSSSLPRPRTCALWRVECVFDWSVYRTLISSFQSQAGDITTVHRHRPEPQSCRRHNGGGKCSRRLPAMLESAHLRRPFYNRPPELLTTCTMTQQFLWQIVSPLSGHPKAWMHQTETRSSHHGEHARRLHDAKTCIRR